MRYFGLIIMFFGIGYGIYVHKTQNRVSIYFRDKIKLVINEEQYFRMQYLLGIINSVIIGLSGLIYYLIDYKHSISIFIITIAILIFHLNNYIFFKLAVSWDLIEKS